VGEWAGMGEEAGIREGLEWEAEEEATCRAGVV
jgi:hypothetical protein